MKESDGSLLCLLGGAGLILCFADSFLNIIPVLLAVYLGAYILGKGPK